MDQRIYCSFLFDAQDEECLPKQTELPTCPRMGVRRDGFTAFRDALTIVYNHHSSAFSESDFSLSLLISFETVSTERAVSPL